MMLFQDMKRLSLFLLLHALLILTSKAVEEQITSSELSKCLQHLKESVTDPKGFLKTWFRNDTNDICDDQDFNQVLFCNRTSNTFNLSLSNMSLQGTFPSLENCTRLTSINLKSNNFTGPLPDRLCLMLPNLTFLSMHGNQLYGRLPDLAACTSLSTLDLSHNRLTGSLPESICVNNKELKLLLRDNNLTGGFPVGIDHCSGSFDLSNNQFTGEIPRDLTLPNVEDLDISNNNFSGILYSYMQRFGEYSFTGNPHLVFQAAPSCLAKFRQSVRDPHNRLVSWSNSSRGNICEYSGVTCNWKSYWLNLRGAGLVGEFPSCLEDWPGLTSLDLSMNQLSGSVPDFKILINQTVLTEVNISHNKLTGAIPSTFTKLCHVDVTSNFFVSPSPGSHRRRLDVALAVGVPLTLAVVAILVRCFKAKIVPEDPEDDYTPQFKLLDHLHLKEKEFLSLTRNFDMNEIIGRGGTSTVCRGFLPDGQPVAVKRLNLEKETMEASRKTFLRELHTAGKLRHRNLVKVLGYYSNLDFMAVILEYMPYGTLEQLLHPKGKSYPLEWSYRYKLAVEIAKGLNYLHHDCGQPLAHNDLKPSNILLDEDFCARITDFGLAKILDEATKNTFTFSWTIGYAAPEVAQGARSSTKADVYSFGIILLEIVTGERPTSEKFENGSMRERVEGALRSKDWQELLDKELHPEVEFLPEMLEVVQVALSCIQTSAASRPDIKTVLFKLVELRDKGTTKNSLLSKSIDLSPSEL